VVIGISTDTLALQQKFTEKENLNFPLYADAEQKATKAFDAFIPGRPLARRCTFIIDKNGIIAKIFDPVGNAGGHPEYGPSRSRARKVIPGEVEIHFLNGSKMRLLVQSEEIEVATPYGKLSVPLREIRAIEFGLHMPEGFSTRIDLAVKKLSSADYRERESAGKTLVELGPFSYGAVLQATRDHDLETTRRAKEILKKLQAAHSKKDLKISSADKVITPTFTIVGRIATPSLKVQEEHFGAAVLSVAKMRTLRAVSGRLQEMELAVDASKYANAGQWLETDFQTDAKTALLITATGLVDLLPQQGGQQTVGPNGMIGIRAARMKAGGFGGGGGAGGGPGMPGGGGMPAGGMMITRQHGGTLFGKIGASGDIFIIGDRYEGTPESEGKLYLHIGPSPYNCQASGSYNVRISPKD
jgi:hypothetical protein